jgi:hypothetical protein
MIPPTMQRGICMLRPPPDVGARPVHIAIRATTDGSVSSSPGAFHGMCHHPCYDDRIVASRNNGVSTSVNALREGRARWQIPERQWQDDSVYRRPIDPPTNRVACPMMPGPDPADDPTTSCLGCKPHKSSVVLRRTSMRSGQASPGQLASSYPTLGRRESGRRAVLCRQRASQIDSSPPLPRAIAIPEPLHTVHDMRDILRRRAIATATDGVADLRELHRRARDLFMRLTDGPKRFRRRRKLRLCRPVLLFRLPAHHFGSPIHHTPLVGQRLPAPFGPLAEWGGILCIFLRITLEGDNP